MVLWLEAHIPGQPLNFLDHHIKCGNAIVGFARREELRQGVPMEAFKTLPGGDKRVAAAYRSKNKEDMKNQAQGILDFGPDMRRRFDTVLKEWQSLSALPEETTYEVDAKKEVFLDFMQGENADILRTIANIPVAQFFIPKIPGNEVQVLTDAEFRGYWRGHSALVGRSVNAARSIGRDKRFFTGFWSFQRLWSGAGSTVFSEIHLT